MSADDYNLKFNSLKEILLQEKYSQRTEETNFLSELKELILGKVHQFIEKLSPNFGSFNNGVDSVLYHPFVYYGFRIILFALVLYVTIKLLKSLQDVIKQFLKSSSVENSNNDQDNIQEHFLNDFQNIKNINAEFLLSFLDKEGVAPTLSLIRAKLRLGYFSVVGSGLGEGVSDRRFVKIVEREEKVKEKKIFLQEVLTYFERNKFEENEIAKSEISDFLKENLDTANQIFTNSKEIEND